MGVGGWGGGGGGGGADVGSRLIYALPTPKHSRNIPLETSHRHHRNIPETFQKHNRNTTYHHQITDTFKKHTSNIPETQNKHFRNTPDTE